MITFQGKTFLIEPENSVPIKISEHQEDNKFLVSNFLSFLNKLKTAGILDEQRKGLILIADD